MQHAQGAHHLADGEELFAFGPRLLHRLVIRVERAVDHRRQPWAIEQHMQFVVAYLWPAKRDNDDIAFSVVIFGLPGLSERDQRESIEMLAQVFSPVLNHGVVADGPVWVFA